MIEKYIFSGCDERIALNPDTGTNRYNLNPLIYDELFMRGSCTCGTLTPSGYDTMQRFDREYSKGEDAILVAKQVKRMRYLLGGNMVDDFSVYFGPSGSDLMYWPLIMQSMLHPGQKITNIVSCPEELGSGSILAAEGKYYSNKNQFMDIVENSGLVEETISVDVKFLSARDPSGHISDRKQAIREIIRSRPGQPIVGNLVYGSKSGIEDDLDIIDEFQEGVMWIVDMCQFRVNRDLIQKLLSKGVMLMVTGSKFYQAPPFCGALLVPKHWTQALHKCSVNHLINYGTIFSSSDVPPELTKLRELWPNYINIGLRLRWEIALDEMESFLALPKIDTDAIIRRWNRIVIGRLALSDVFGIMPDIERTNDSIISFSVSVEGKELKFEELKLLFDKLVLSQHFGFNGYTRVFLGQPVKYGSRAFLRLAIGAYSIRMLMLDFDPSSDIYLVDLIEKKAKELFN